jgi:hypothetical protein
MATSAETVMRTIVEIFSTGDLDAVSSVVAPGYVDHQGLGDGEITGPDGFKRVVEAARNDLADLRAIVQDFFVEAHGVAARLRWQGVGPSGDTITRETIDVLRVEAGRAVEHWGAQLCASVEPAGERAGKGGRCR